MTEQQGKAYLVGAGVGNPVYLTIRGHQLLTQADVLVYDALVDQTLLQLVPDRCIKLDVGKRGGQPSPPQAEINRLLVQYCQQGKQVVRLKSGDPFIFGRSTAEIQALAQANCEFEVVPGISSALAAPLLAGIPLTDPVLSRCFAVLSAHEPEELDWASLAPLETLVILMGGRCLPEIIEQLLRHGRSPQTPIAIIRWAGHAQQQVWTGNLLTIGQQTQRQTISPAVIVIGEVVRLRPYLQFSPTFSAPMTPSAVTPLRGKTVLVTRAAGQSSQFTLLLQQQGATVIEMPTLEITPPSSWDALDAAIDNLPSFNWLILTSTNGVDYFFERLIARGQDVRSLANVKIAVVGQKTAESLQRRGIKPDFIPPDFVADSLIEHFPDRSQLSNVKILFPRVESGGREVLVKELTAQGAEVVEVAAYQSGCAQSIAPEAALALQQGRIDVVTFASSKTVKCFAQLLETLLNDEDLAHLPSMVSLDSLKESVLNKVCIASIGPQTSATCQQLFGRVDLEAQEYTLEGLTDVIVQWAIDRSSV